VGSSYATASEGLSAYAQLLRGSGHPVARVQVAPAKAGLDPGSTVILLAPARMDFADVTALRRFVAAGGELVAGGPNPRAWLDGLLGDPPSWSASGPTSAQTALPTRQTASVERVLTSGGGSWRSPGASLPVLGSRGAWLLTVARIGRGSVSLLADSSPLENRGLAAADNAALGEALAGPAGRPVAFEEAVHGYGEGNGLAALPTRWKWTLLGLLLAAFVAVAARARRLSAPDPRPAVGLPPRRAHVEALADALARTRDPQRAIAPVREHARARLSARAHLEPRAGEDELFEAGRRLGLDGAELRALGADELTDEDVMPAGRALVALSEGPR
jgi:hypothetical protein